MPKCSGWDIWLEIEGKKLEEYGSKQEKLEDERAPSVTCWVPCEAGKEFRFGVAPPPKPLKSNHLLCFTVDGHELVDIDHRDFDEGEDYGPNPTLYEGQEDDEGFRPFMFANLTLTSDDDFIDTGMGQLGELLVHIYKYKSIVYKKCKPKKRVRSSAASRFGELKPRAGLTANSGARQASSSSVGTSKPEIKKYTSKYTYQKLVGIVNFKYRSIDILRAEGIAPRLPPVTLSPSPKRPLPAPNSDHRAPTLQAASKLSNGISDNEDEDDDELRALQARLAILEELSEVKAQIAAKLSKKRKRDSKGKVDEPRRVKKEVKIEHFLPGEVIDLT